MISRSVRPGHSRDSATELPLARAIRFRAKRPMISVEMRLRWATATPCLDWEDSLANPFNPETRPRHHLEQLRISRWSRKCGAKSGFNQPCGVKAVKPAQAGVLMRQGAGQRTQIAFRGQDFAEARDLVGLDRRAAHGGFGGQKRCDGL